MIKTKPDELLETRERTPLQEFKGRLMEWVVAPPDQWERTYVNLQFVDVEVIKSSESYPYPVAEIAIKYSDRTRSGWGFFIRSMGEVTEQDVEVEEDKVAELGPAPHAPFAEDFRDLVGLTLHMLKRVHHYGENPETGDPMLGEVWMLVGLEGEVTEKVDATVQAISLMQGLTVADWQRKALKDSNVKSDAAVMSSILNNTLLPALIEEGRVTQDEDTGILHVVEG